jgi:putative tryptophan/tyrosine transport system substrate-binding protein
MRRRYFVFGLLAVATIGGVRAQQSKGVHRIALVEPATSSRAELAERNGNPFAKAFFHELRRFGYIEGQNLLIERYSGEGHASHYPDLARDVVRNNPDLIIAFTNELALDFKAATTTIPIVGVFADPIETGIAASLAHPGSNVTGATIEAAGELWPKRLQLFHEMVPQAIRLGNLHRRANRDEWEALGRPGEDIPRKMGITIPVGPPLDFPIDDAEYRRVFVALMQDHADGFMVSDDFENYANCKVIVELAEKNRLPAIYPSRLFVEAGGLMSYGVDLPALGQRVAAIVGQILKGMKPAEIPIFQPTKFELVINLKTAKMLGLTVPPALLATADEVIE